jgi:predicted site-specific integrase-resolvase
MELSVKLGIGLTTVRAYLKTGRIKGQKVAGKWYVSEDSLKEFFLKGTQIEHGK